MIKNLLLFIFCTLSFAAYSQTSKTGTATSKNNTPVESKRASKSRFSTSITLGGNYQDGNTEIIGISGNGRVASVDSIKEFSFDAKYIYNENKKQAVQREYLLGLQFDYLPLARFSPFVRGEFYSNKARKIKGRCSLLLGAKYRYYVNKNISDYSVSAAFIYDYEEYANDIKTANKEKFRLSVRPKFKQKVMENIYCQWEIYLKPNIADIKDHIIHSIAIINFKVNKYVNINASYEYEYDSMPVKSYVKKADTLLTFGCGISF